MGWGTDFTTNIYLNRQLFRSIEEVLDKIEDLEEDLHSIELRLIFMLAINNSEYDKEADLFIDFRETLQWRDDTIKELQLLYIYKEYIEDGNELIKKE